MTIKSLEDLIIAFDAVQQQLGLQDTRILRLLARLNADAVRVEDLIGSITELREQVEILEATFTSSHKGIIARLAQLERQQRRLENQQATLPGVVTRLVDSERRVRALTTQTDRAREMALDLNHRLNDLDQVVANGKPQLRK